MATLIVACFPGGVRPYADIPMPDWFVLEVQDGRGGWVEHGRYRARDFDRLPDGTYLCAGHGGSALWLRCLRQSGNRIDVVDGAGHLFTYRLVPIPKDHYGFAIGRSGSP